MSEERIETLTKAARLAGYNEVTAEYVASQFLAMEQAGKGNPLGEGGYRPIKDGVDFHIPWNELQMQLFVMQEYIEKRFSEIRDILRQVLSSEQER